MKFNDYDFRLDISNYDLKEFDFEFGRQYLIINGKPAYINVGVKNLYAPVNEDDLREYRIKKRLNIK